MKKRRKKEKGSKNLTPLFPEDPHEDHGKNEVEREVGDEDSEIPPSVRYVPLECGQELIS